MSVAGYGLGLSISKRIVEKLGGEVGVMSHDGTGGSLFYFTLPAATEAKNNDDKPNPTYHATHKTLKPSTMDMLPVEEGRLDRHRTEFAITQCAIAEYLPTSPAQVLDDGGGPGRYALWLAETGHAVTLLDLSQQ